MRLLVPPDEQDDKDKDPGAFQPARDGDHEAGPQFPARRDGKSGKSKAQQRKER